MRDLARAGSEQYGSSPIKNINILDTNEIRIHNRIGKGRKANLKGIRDAFRKVPKEGP